MSDPREQPGITGSELAAGRERAARRAAEAQAADAAAAAEQEHAQPDDADQLGHGDGEHPGGPSEGATPLEADQADEQRSHRADGPPRDTHDRQDAPASAASQSRPDEGETGHGRPRAKRGRRWLVRALILAILVLIGWDVAARYGGGSSTGSPGGAPSSQSSSTARHPAKKDIKVAVTFETKSSTQKAKKWCDLVARPKRCINVLGDTPPAGLTKPVRVLRSALVPGRAAHDDGSVATNPGTPEVAAVLTVQSNHDRHNIKELVLVRTSDHKVIATELIGQDQGGYTPAQLAGRILAGHESDAVTW